MRPSLGQSHGASASRGSWPASVLRILGPVRSGCMTVVHGFDQEPFTALVPTNHHDRDLVTPAHENHPLSPRWGERGRVRGVYFHGKIPNKNIGALRLFKNPFKGLVNALVGWMHSFSIGSSSPGPPSVQIPSRPETDQFSNTIPTPSGNRRYWRSLRRKILPTAFLGSASMNSTTRGTLKVARCCLQWSMIA